MCWSRVELHAFWIDASQSIDRRYWEF